jgi:hypothetical protein
LFALITGYIGSKYVVWRYTFRNKNFSALDAFMIIISGCQATRTFAVLE